uniref:Uncharacterized protein n=1 Tax=Anguilla anguilla TaxID=7936 RepID=A0A0E9TY02_ANGAN
METNSNPGV